MKIVRDYITPEENKRLLDSLESIPKKHWGLVFGHHDSPNESIMAMRVFAYNRYVGDILHRLNIEKTAALELLRYPTGTSSQVHMDEHGSHYDSTLVRRDVSWSKTGVVLLNDDFEGGELFFPALNMSFGKEYKNCLIEFPAGISNPEYVHGVTEVLSGVRYTLVIRYD